MASGGSVAVEVLGDLRLTIDGRSLGPTDLGGRKPKQVVEVLLVHQGDAVAKDRIADLLWGERLPADPMRTLEAHVSGVRPKLHPDPDRARRLLRSEPGAYRLVLDDADVDMWRFDDLAARAAVASTGERLGLREQALGLVRGMEWVARFMRLSVSLSTAKTVIDQCSTVDIRHLLNRVTAPTLVLHRRDEQWLQPANGRYVAEHIPGARFVELPGVDHWPWMGDSDSVLAQFDAFIGELATPV